MSPATAKLQIVEALADARSLTDNLFRQIRPEAWLDRPIPRRHRLLFYAGHLEAFDWNQIGRATLHHKPVSEELDDLFAFGIDPPPGELPADRPEDWPDLGCTQAYVADVRRCLDSVVGEAPAESLHIALEHRLMHAETLVYLLHQLPYERRVLPEGQSAPVGVSPAPRMMEIPEGDATLGRSRDAGFGWDNEFDEHRQHVAAFSMSKYKVTNGQYLEFVRDGGPAPLFWFERDGEWWYRGYREELPLPDNWPVYVSFDQASAYAEWAGKALPTEAQFHRAAYGSEAGVEREYPWGDETPAERHGNFDFCGYDPVSVAANPRGDSAFGVSQLVGNGWEWTRTAFAPFDGFAPFATYSGYSANFFDGEHFVLKGGSPVTCARLLRRSFRNWFRREYPYAYTTFRLVEE